MSTPSGLSAQLGFKEETVYGTAVTVDRFIPFLDESIESTFDVLETNGIIAGARVVRSSQWTQGVWHHEGDIGIELSTRSCGLLFHHALGSITTASSAGTSTHIITAGDLTGKGLTVQIGRPDSGGTVRPFTYAGTKIASWELGVAATENATMGLTVVAQSVTTATSLASATYVTGGSPFSFASGSFTLAGSSLCVRSARISGDNQLDTGRLCVGQSYIDEPVEQELREFMGEVELEFPDLYHWDRFVQGTEGALKLVLQQGTKSLTVDANVRTDADPINVSGRGMLVGTMSFKCVGTNSDSSALTLTYVTADTTP